MSGMSSILCIPLYRPLHLTTSRNEKGEQPLGTLLCRKASPFNQLLARGALGDLDECPVCCSCPLMRSTPGFWMAAR